MSATGYIQVRAYTSRAELPLKDVAVTILAEDGTAIAMRLTDRSGLIAPIALPVPDLAESQSPDPDETPYTMVSIFAHKKGYEQILSEGIQVFAGVTTSQELEMIPLSELPDYFDEAEFYVTPPQDL